MATPAPVPAAPPNRWFWFNLGLLALLAPFATYWFQRHLAYYFTEIVVVGGSITLWAFARAAWGLVEKIGKLDPLAASRSVLASPETALVLAVAAVGLLVLWCTTTSMYFEYDGGSADASRFVVHVAHKADGAPYMADVSVDASTRVAGQARLLRGTSTPLVCTIVEPMRYQPLDCPAELGVSTRVRVPASFKPRVYHLLRIVPGQDLYSELPNDSDESVERYRLELRVDNRVLQLDDLRRQTVYAGGLANDLPLMQSRLEDSERYERLLDASLRSVGIDAQRVAKMAAVLSLRTRRWDTFEVRAGQKLQFNLTARWVEDGKEQSRQVDGFPFDYTVTPDKVQTVWLPTL